MKIKPNFALRQIAGNWVIIPLGDETANLAGILTVNGSGAFLWNQLEQDKTPEQLVDVMLAEYDVTRDVAHQDVLDFLEKLRDCGCLE